MSMRIPSGKTRLLLVEGKTDKEFFIQLGFHLKFTAETPLHIMEYQGKDLLEGSLANIQNDPNFPKVTHIGIVRDADFTGGAFDSVIAALKNANAQNPARVQYTLPQQPAIFASGKIAVGVFIMPNENSNGMLESLILSALEGDSIMTCVDDYFACLGEKGIEAKPEPMPKARMRVYMAAQYQAKMRTFIEGKNVDIEATGGDRDRSYLSDIYKMSWWNWEHSAFDEIKAFLRQLAE